MRMLKRVLRFGAAGDVALCIALGERRVGLAVVARGGARRAVGVRRRRVRMRATAMATALGRRARWRKCENGGNSANQ